MVMAYETIKSENHIFMQQDVFVVILATQRAESVFLIVSTLMKRTPLFAPEQKDYAVFVFASL